MRTVVLHASSFDECWAHYYFHADPDFLGRLRERGYELVLSKDATPEATARAAAVIYLEAFSAGAGKESRLRKLRRKLATRLRLPGIPRRPWDPASHLRPWTPFPPGHPAFFDPRGRPRILLALEGVMHAADDYNPEARRHFDHVLTWNDALVEPGRTTTFHVPQPRKFPAVAPTPFAAKKLLASISANKRVKHPLELYTERRRALARLARALPDQFDFYGMGWEGTALGRSSCYRGEAKDKASVFSRYRFALVYENAQVPGYVSEKIWDAMRSGCVPVYLGAPNVGAYVPEACFVDRRRFASDAALAAHLATVTEAEHDKRLAAIRAFLDGPGFQPFLTTSFADAIASAVEAVR